MVFAGEWIVITFRFCIWSTTFWYGSRNWVKKWNNNSIIKIKELKLDSSKNEIIKIIKMANKKIKRKMFYLKSNVISQYYCSGFWVRSGIKMTLHIKFVYWIMKIWLKYNRITKRLEFEWYSRLIRWYWIILNLNQRIEMEVVIHWNPLDELKSSSKWN